MKKVLSVLLALCLLFGAVPLSASAAGEDFVIDEKGVGKLVQMAVTQGKQTRAKIKLGICGEHGGNPKTIDFCQRVGLNYVSCSPFRVPIARLAAAQAAINNGKN